MTTDRSSQLLKLSRFSKKMIHVSAYLLHVTTIQVIGRNELQQINAPERSIKMNYKDRCLNCGHLNSEDILDFFLLRNMVERKWNNVDRWEGDRVRVPGLYMHLVRIAEIICSWPDSHRYRIVVRVQLELDPMFFQYMFDLLIKEDSQG